MYEMMYYCLVYYMTAATQTHLARWNGAAGPSVTLACRWLGVEVTCLGFVGLTCVVEVSCCLDVVWQPPPPPPCSADCVSINVELVKWFEVLLFNIDDSTRQRRAVMVAF